MKMKGALLVALLVSTISINAGEIEMSNGDFQPMVAHQFIEEAKKNVNWKTAFATGKQEQIVFMNISPVTNPNNEVGQEVHSFDQVILIVEGNGKAVLNGKTSMVKEGDLIFIPQGTQHNIVNLNEKKELKLVSFYSQTDIPKGAKYKTKADTGE